jgi:hypothetical protein
MPVRRRPGYVPGNTSFVDRCPSCRDAIVWALTERCQRVPVNAQQTVDGNLVLCYLVDGRDVPIDGLQLVRPADPDYPGPRWWCHWATCPASSAWRRQRAREGKLG